MVVVVVGIVEIDLNVVIDVNCDVGVVGDVSCSFGGVGVLGPLLDVSFCDG